MGEMQSRSRSGISSAVWLHIIRRAGPQIPRAQSHPKPHPKSTQTKPNTQKFSSVPYPQALLRSTRGAWRACGLLYNSLLIGYRMGTRGLTNFLIHGSNKGKTKSKTSLMTTIRPLLKQVLPMLWTPTKILTIKVPSVIPPRPLRLPQRPLRRLSLLLWRAESLCCPYRTSRWLTW